MTANKCLTPKLSEEQSAILIACAYRLDEVESQYLAEELRSVQRELLAASPASQPAAAPIDEPKLAVWYGSMPESNGKSNWTAILHNGNIGRGITLDRSEYPDRVRYEADRARWLIGELAVEPSILDYDADKHSGYTAPSPADERAETRALPMMRSAFRVTEVSGDPDPEKQRFYMRFSFTSIEALHAADDEWRKFLAAAQADARVGLTDAQRKAIQNAIDWCYAMAFEDDERALRALLQGANHV